jgi:hypothetical protein
MIWGSCKPERAKTIQQQNPRPPAKMVLEQLIGVGVPTPPHSREIAVSSASGERGSIRLNTNDKSAVISLKNMEPERLEALETLIKTFLSDAKDHPQAE